MAEVPDELTRLERTAEEERAKLAGLSGDAYDAQVRRWREASEAVRAAVAAYATATGANRDEVEQAVRCAVRKSQEDPAVE
ncbi:hypothetical protein [Streptomyces sp. NBC_00557]|uniref:hypothetical protein n=1 Tax=Streptomyces sp. NBC_00557 TaxID=2975776 RepID=UPI002E81E23B|nr:hypothetical protein [Streptomyces sp. NBC_00557]WUC39050.1 hypothetical protein OG956_34875 [Streptomyces sp. NBC_00557]